MLLLGFRLVNTRTQHHTIPASDCIEGDFAPLGVAFAPLDVVIRRPNDVMDAFPLMMKLKEKDTYVLLENDLPDSFNEKLRSDKK